MNTQNENGTGIIEAIVVISIMSVIFAAILSAAVFFIRGSLFIADETQAVFLLDESVEVARFMRDTSFSSNIAPLIGTGPVYLEPNSTSWIATSTNTLILGKYSRTVEFTEVYRRNTDDTIVPTSSGDPKTLDTGTARLIVTISWPKGSLQTTTYITDLYEN